VLGDLIVDGSAGVAAMAGISIETCERPAGQRPFRLSSPLRSNDTIVSSKRATSLTPSAGYS